MTTPLNILILGGVGAQNSHVAKELAVAGHKVRILTRDTQKRGARELAALPGIEIVQGDTYDEETLEVALRGIQSVYVNTNGFAIGERSEIYWSIRIYEIAYWAGVKHFVYSTLPYVSRRSGFNPKFRVPFVDGKAKFAGKFSIKKLMYSWLTCMFWYRVSQVPADESYELELN